MTDHLRLITLTNLGSALLVACLIGVPAAAQDSSGVAMVVSEGEAGAYWARWRGPSGQGIVEGTGYPDTWSDTTNVVWKTAVPGRGNSSPIVWGDRIFLPSA